jgi:hypothetical protein
MGIARQRAVNELDCGSRDLLNHGAPDRLFTPIFVALVQPGLAAMPGS